jgi:hypothetical protein
LTYGSRPGIAAVGAAAAAASENIDEALNAEDAGTADLMLVAVASGSCGRSTAAAAGARHNFDRSSRSSGDERKNGKSSGSLHVAW